MNRTKLAALGTAVLLALATLVGFSVTAAPASAGVSCTKYGLCGDVYYNGGSRSYLLTTCDWTDKYPTARAYTGQWSSCYDVDGFYVPNGCYALLAGGTLAGGLWYKVNDVSNVTVTLSC